MNYILIILLLLFYLFFFSRAYILSRKLKKDIKAKDNILNLSIFFAGLSSLIFLLSLIGLVDLTILVKSIVYSNIGSMLIILGITTSIIASLSLKDSWRIGVSTNEKTKLITSGIFQYSRNPYFLSFNVVLIGMMIYMPSLFIIIPGITTIILFHMLIIKEESYLEKEHKDNYKKYREQIGRYIWFIK